MGVKMEKITDDISLLETLRKKNKKKTKELMEKAEAGETIRLI